MNAQSVLESFEENCLEPNEEIVSFDSSSKKTPFPNSKIIRYQCSVSKSVSAVGKFGTRVRRSASAWAEREYDNSEYSVQVSLLSHDVAPPSIKIELRISETNTKSLRQVE